MDADNFFVRGNRAHLALAPGECVSVTCSICIANYNGIGLIDECLASVRAQNFGDPIEIIVHDDASNDGSAEHIRANYPDVLLIESKKNVGFCVANNRMADAAQGQYLLLLNNDAALLPGALTTLKSEAVRLGRPAILSLPQYDAETEDLLDIGSLLDPFLNPIPNLNPRLNDVGMVMGACLWIPKILWDELGGFPEWFESLAEDMFLCIYAFILGHDIAVLNKSGYFHKVGHSFGGGKIKQNKLVTTYKRRRLSERNKCYVMILFYPAFLLNVILPVHLFLLFIEGLLLAMIKRDLKIFVYIYLNAFKDLWRRKSFLYKKRSLYQSKRRISYRKLLSVFIYFPCKLKMLLIHGLPSVR